MESDLKPTKYLAVLLAIIGVLMLVYAFATPNEHIGMGGDSITYSDTNLVLAVAGAFLAAIGMSYFFLRQEYVPYVPPSPSPASIEAEKKPPAKEATEVKDAPPGTEERMNEIALRLLTGDERVLYKAIVDSGGTALQKDLIVTTRMSDAKVSRTIDRLVEKGMVTKERYGVTNRIKTTTGK